MADGDEAGGMTGLGEWEAPTGGRLMRTVSRFTTGPPVPPIGRGGRVILTVSFLDSSLIFLSGV